MQIRTHASISRELCGVPKEVREGFASVELTTTEAMAADERRLVHGGFLFGLADYAAMLAVNDPHVVLARAEVRFLKPVVVGEVLLAEATLYDQEGPKKLVNAEIRRGEERILSGEFVCYTPERHVLDR